MCNGYWVRSYISLSKTISNLEWADLNIQWKIVKSHRAPKCHYHCLTIDQLLAIYDIQAYKKKSKSVKNISEERYFSCNLDWCQWPYKVCIKKPNKN